MGQHHGHEHDRGVGGFLHYLRRFPQMWRSDLNSEMVRAIAPRAGERVVDLGAGMGAATIDAAATGASVIAVDPASYMRWIVRLRRLWPDRGTVTVLDGAAEFIPVADASIDALWTVNTIHHWTDPAMAARELARIVRPGGRVLLLDEDTHDPARAKARRSAHRFYDVDVEAIARTLRAAGFAEAEGSRTTFAGRPAKVIRAVR